MQHDLGAPPSTWVQDMVQSYPDTSKVIQINVI